MLLGLAGPLSPSAQAQEAVARKPPISAVKCVVISEAEVLRHASGGSVIDILRIRVPGLQIATADWQSRTTSSMGLRGTNSFVGPREPLVFVDGLRLSQPGGIDYLDVIDPLDVELIEILPGPAATTLYGTGASSGVILIYTKRGASSASGSGGARGVCHR
jgi:TonB-dependent SusC/RagA subfamily outer membrane receptor